jgi:hypothetical protein
MAWIVTSSRIWLVLFVDDVDLEIRFSTSLYVGEYISLLSVSSQLIWVHGQEEGVQLSPIAFWVVVNYHF